jgi:hypothetical protein
LGVTQEEIALKILAEDLLNLTTNQINKALSAGELKEIDYEQ